MVEQYMQENKNQFDVFDYEEDGSFKPIFMVGKCQPEEASSPVDSPTTVIVEEEQKEPAYIELERISQKSNEKKIDIRVEGVNLKIDTPSKPEALTTTKKQKVVKKKKQTNFFIKFAFFILL